MLNNECHQNKIKRKNRSFDLETFKLTESEVKQLSIKDLEFEVIKKSDKEKVHEVKKFITRYEWLESINNYWNYAFALTYNGKFVSVIMIGCPGMFSKLLGEDTKDIEQTLHRGASNSIAPKNSGSFLITKAINWMVKNTPYRVFYGFSTTHGANEYGYIYQSLNAILISKRAGTRYEYLKPGTKNKWLSDRHLRKLSNYRKIARNLGLKWEKGWNSNWKINWNMIPENISKLIRAEYKEQLNKLTFRKVHPKLKYAIIKGRNRRETNELLNRFKLYNPKLVNRDGTLGHIYPKKDTNHFSSKEVENDF